ncbi:MAG TPA: VWA domain-containing protein [Alphaproteobacteria bacterium]|nr:VWA domain-containing protein [Alphaproteobacteria bacterium]
MTFLWPKLLWLLLLVPVLFGAYVMLMRRKKKVALRYASLSMVKEAMGPGPGIRRHIPPAIFLLALTVLILAVARPAAVITLPSLRGTVILAMDVSGSMRATDVEPTRFEAAQAAAKTFVNEQSSDVRIGVVAFAASALVVQAPTTNKEEVVNAIERFSGQFGTAVGSGILVSLATIFDDKNLDIGLPDYASSIPGQGGGFDNQDFGQRGIPLGDHSENKREKAKPVAPGSYASAVIVLLTDGQTTTGYDPIKAAKKAAELGVRVYTVGIGTSQGAILGFGGRSMRVQLDEDTLKQIAQITHAKYFHASSATDLKEIYQSLKSEFVLETKKTEITAGFAAFAGVLVLIGAFLSMWWFNRIA